MKMTIKDCINELLINKEDDTYVLGSETINFAIDTMLKYEQIEEIVKQYKKFGNIDFSMQIISGVVEDGNDD